MVKSQTGGGDSYAVGMDLPPHPSPLCKNSVGRAIENVEATKIYEVKTMANCETCKGKDAHAPESVPFIVHESSMARMERQIKRLWIALIVAIIVAVVAPLTVHFGWLHYESQFETYEYTQDGEGTNIIGDGNDVNNGAEAEGNIQEEQ